MVSFAVPQVVPALPSQERTEPSPLERTNFPSAFETPSAYPGRYPPAVVLDADRRADLFLPSVTSSVPASAKGAELDPLQRLEPDARKYVEEILKQHATSSSESRAIRSAFAMPETAILDSFQSANLAHFLQSGASEWFNRAPAESKIQLLYQFAEPENDPRAAMKILESGAFQQMTLEQRGRVIDLMVGSSEIDGLAALSSRTVGPGKIPALLATDSRGATVLDNMERILASKSFADPELLKMREELLASSCKILGDPSRITQGNRNTCGAAACAWDFATRDPGETSRVLADIAVKGKAELRNSREILTLDTGSVEPDNNGRRVLADRLLQVSIMQYGAGSADYRNADDLKHDGDKTSSGMKPVRTNKLLSAFYGRPAVMSLMTDFDRVEPEQFMKEFNRSLGIGNTLVSMQWGNDPKDKGAGNHAIAVTKIADGRLYFRNSQGETPLVGNGEEVRGDGPPVRIENRRTGEQSMSIKDFTDRVIWAYEWTPNLK